MQLRRRRQLSWAQSSNETVHSQPLCDLLFWESSRPFHRRGQAHKTYIKMTLDDTGLTKKELKTLDLDKEQWHHLCRHSISPPCMSCLYMNERRALLLIGELVQRLETNTEVLFCPAGRSWLFIPTRFNIHHPLVQSV